MGHTSSPPRRVWRHRSEPRVQGAIIDGKEGIAFPKPEKILKYAQLGLMLVDSTQCTQKQVQVVGGGMVYCAMFRRPLLGCLNEIWSFISAFEGYPPFIKLDIPSMGEDGNCPVCRVAPPCIHGFPVQNF